MLQVLVDEGVRWLLANDRRREAARVLHKVAKVSFSDSFYNKLTYHHEQLSS